LKFFWEGLKDAVDLLLHPDASLLKILEVTLQVALWSTLIALLIGLPLGLALALGEFRGRRTLQVLANAGLGLPPVVIGLICALLFFRNAPLGFLNLIYTVKGVIVAQTLLALPVVAALTASAVMAVPASLLDQARAFGASTAQVCVLALREARVGVFAAGIAALGSALSEVGAVVLVGGNIQGDTETLASATLTQVGAGEYGRAMALGIILLGLIVVIATGLTVAQQREAEGALRRAS
jgi:tungstate transport system permease protein